MTCMINLYSEKERETETEKLVGKVKKKEGDE